MVVVVPHIYKIDHNTERVSHMSMISREKAGLSTRDGIANYTRKPEQISEFIVHYGDGTTPKTEAQELSIIRNYDSYHASKGWGGIGYNLAVGPVTGNVYEARGLNRVGAHTVGHNTSGIGVVLIGGADVLTEKAKTGLKEAYKIANNYAGKQLAVSGHRDHADTDCPGEAAYAWLKSGGLQNNNNNNNQGDTMAGKPTTYVDGRLVAAGTAAAFYKLAAAFNKATGYTLHIRDGLRTYKQQKDLYDRWKAGTFFAPSVAKPGTSRHETGRALDVYDSGSTPGVTVAGNKRSNWLKNNASKYGFSPTGYGFREPWHIEYQGNPWAGSGSSSSSSTATNGGFSTDYIKTIQKLLQAKGHNLGPAGVDGSLGPTTTAAVKAFQSANGLEKDGLPGPKTLAALKSNGKLTLDGSFGTASVTRLQQVLGTPADGVITGQSAASKTNHQRLVSVRYGNGGSTAVRALQRKLGVTADGYMGPNTIKAWQKKLGVASDGYFGPNTAKAAQRALNNGKLW